VTGGPKIFCTGAPKLLRPPLLLGILMQHGDVKFFIMTHQLSEARNLSPNKTRNPHGTLKTHVTPLHVLRYTRVPRNPCWEYWAGLYFYTHTEIHFDEHKSNYTFIIFTQKCFLDPTKRFCSQVQNLLTTATRLPTVIYHTPKFYNFI